jgi:hypothetical protein
VGVVIGTVDEEAEKVAQPEGPVSSWLLQEAEAQRQVGAAMLYVVAASGVMCC